MAEGTTTRNCLWGANRIGDKKLSIDRITFLRNLLIHHGNMKLAGKRLTVSNFTIHINSGYMSREAGQGGAIGNWINKEPIDCPIDNLYGSYSRTEADPNAYPRVLVIVVDVDTNGIVKHYRRVKPLEKDVLQNTLESIAIEISDNTTKSDENPKPLAH
jgi:hypothetical protein